MKTKIDKYFENKGVKTIFNCLGNNEKLVRAYVGNFYKDVQKTNLENSQHLKISNYSKLYTIQPRHKMTGFEFLKKEDAQFRKDVSQFITEPQYSPLFLVNNDEHDSQLSYKKELLDFAKTIQKPLLYLSGGLDSELVANAFLEAGIRFDVVIFEWTNNGNHIINSSEIFHAYKFCKKHGIIPIIKQINIEKLWASNYFKKLSILLQIQSPQLVTYAHMIEMMSLEFINSTHVFGGEVKFRTNYYLDNGNKSNLVFLDKLVPSYDGQTYVDSFVGSDSEIADIRLIYAGFNGSWYIDSYHVGPFLASGNWTDTPGVLYNYNVTSVVINSNYPSSINVISPPSGPTGWNVISYPGAPLATVQVARVTVGSPGYGESYYASATFYISVRVSGETVPVQDSSVTFTCSTSYI